MKGTAGLALCAAFSVMLACPMQADASSKRGTNGGKPAASASHSHSRSANATRSSHSARSASHGGSRHATRSGRSRGTSTASYGGGSISCVPYARMVTGMQISGNGGRWWHNAAGSYDRGQRPESGSILAFASSGGMRSGHVAVVSHVHGPRHIEIDHANWGGPGIRRGSVMHNVDVIDVSERNDWTQVRVQVGWDAGTFGRVYPTYGFIYNRPERSMMASMTGVSSASARPVATRFEEVAEAPDSTPVRRSSRSHRSHR